MAIFEHFYIRSELQDPNQLAARDNRAVVVTLYGKDGVPLPDYNRVGAKIAAATAWINKAAAKNSLIKGYLPAP